MARGRLRATLTMLGPAFVAAVAYVDPGNFATNIQGGAKFGYLLLWVVLLANLMAMLIQYLSAKLGIATGHNLPELCRERFPRWVSWGLWIQAEVMAMATDVAEFLGAALGLNLLFGVPLFAAGLITGRDRVRDPRAAAPRAFARFELAIAALLGIVFAGFLYETLRIGPSAHRVAARPRARSSHGTSALYLAVGIVGATVMPHVIYLHSALTQGRMPVRDDGERRRVLRFERVDVIVALGLAGVINLAMLAVAAKLFHVPRPVRHRHRSRPPTRQFGRLVGGGAALAFAVALLASGASSSSVGTYAGQVVMAGLHQRPDPDRAPPRGDDDAGAGDPRARGHTDRRARAQPGRAVVRDPVRAGPAGDAHRPPRRDGRRTSTAGCTSVLAFAVAAGDHGDERVPDRPAVRLASSTLQPRWPRSPTASTRSSSRCPTTGPIWSSTCGSSTSAATSRPR